MSMLPAQLYGTQRRMDDVQIEVYRTNSRGIHNMDTVTINAEQWSYLLNLLEQDIAVREAKLGHVTKMYDNPEYRSKHENLVDLLVTLDM
jgi:hypothetical protein